MHSSRSYSLAKTIALVFAASLGTTAFASENDALNASQPADVVNTDKLVVPGDLLQWASAGNPEGEERAARLHAAYQADGSEVERLSRVVAIVGELEPRVQVVVAMASRASVESTNGKLRAELAAPPSWLLDDNLPASARASVALLVAGELHARQYYEESLAWLEGVDGGGTVAPHIAAYYRAVAHHQLVELDKARTNAEAVLELRSHAGRRHRELAELILRDVNSADPDSPENLARQMNDIRRRLRLGRADDPEQDLQKQVIDGLDKIIEQAEQQRQQQQQASSDPSQAPSNPAEESRPSDMKGPGEVDPRDIAKGGDWGSLPPQERERITQQIGRDFPGYYRDVIEAYFRSLASGDDSPSADTTPPR